MTRADLEPYVPADRLAVLREAGGTLGARLTTTDEQRRDALRHMAEALAAQRATEGSMRVTWSRGEPTVLEVHGHLEHLPGPAGTRLVFAVDRLAERTLSGAEVPRDEAARLRRLRAELAELETGA